MGIGDIFQEEMVPGLDMTAVVTNYDYDFITSRKIDWPAKWPNRYGSRAANLFKRFHERHFVFRSQKNF